MGEKEPNFRSAYIEGDHINAKYVHDNYEDFIVVYKDYGSSVYLTIRQADWLASRLDELLYEESRAETGNE